jgi:hypothetical protein
VNAVPEGVGRAVSAALAGAGLPADTPVLATSAKSKLGRDDMWRLIGEELLAVGATSGVPVGDSAGGLRSPASRSRGERVGGGGGERRR